MKFILICATGRSGSTTLQRIIHTIPQSHITGEKYRSIIYLLKAYKDMKLTKKMNSRPFMTSENLEKNNIWPAWYNSFDVYEVTKNIKETILSFLIPSSKMNNVKILGYKCIRYFNAEDLELLDLFVELFPNTKIILNISDDIERQSKSKWYKNNPNSKEILHKRNDLYITHSKTKPYYYLKYMKNIFDVNHMRNLFKWLEEPFDEKRYKDILNNKLE